jgi:Conserved membrane protein (DUF2044).
MSGWPYLWTPTLFISDISSEEIASTRKDLKLLLTQLLMGDDVAADYLICYLLSRV